MTASAIEDFRRRGACPGLSAPMATGDGLLVRFGPIGTMPLAALGALCEAAKCHGNGIIEVTARGNIQVRGLSAESAPDFADAVAALGIAAEGGVPIICNPLAGLDPEELIDASSLAADLRRTLARSSLTSRLSPKVSIVLDGGGSYRFDISADIRLCALNGGRSLGIDVAGKKLGSIAIRDAVVAVTRLLGVVARHGRVARARDIASAEGISSFYAALNDLITDDRSVQSAANDGEATGLYRLRGGSVACALALAFGHADATSLQQLTAAAEAAGGCGFRTAADRALLAIGLRPETTESFTATAKELGFIVDAADPRRHVVACPGAPICGSGHIAARTLAPAIAAAGAQHLEGAFKIHVSGCAKGCAHPAQAALTIVGTETGCALVGNGSARDNPFMIVPANKLVGKIAGLIRKQQAGAGHG